MWGWGGGGVAIDGKKGGATSKNMVLMKLKGEGEGRGMFGSDPLTLPFLPSCPFCHTFLFEGPNYMEIDIDIVKSTQNPSFLA